ncbi:hypothetical protein ACIQWR_06245 [Streptomyces sp. NPDC098789]|uniref:hypothetical protein n=1 Tax=Streptomyces sp. NPDC098789 TaxID=3366098 RepID=UPI0037F183A4
MIVVDFEVTRTDVVTCEACWRAPVGAARIGRCVRDLLCVPCAEAGCPVRVELFPPLGVYGLTAAKVTMGKHAGGPPQLPPDPGPALPSPPPTPTPGRPPV